MKNKIQHITCGKQLVHTCYIQNELQLQNYAKHLINLIASILTPVKNAIMGTAS